MSYSSLHWIVVLVVLVFWVGAFAVAKKLIGNRKK